MGEAAEVPADPADELEILTILSRAQIQKFCSKLCEGNESLRCYMEDTGDIYKPLESTGSTRAMTTLPR